MWIFHVCNRRHYIVLILQILCILPDMKCIQAQYTCEVGQEKTPDNQWRWVLPYEHPCKCSRIRFGGTNTDTPKRPFEPIYVEKPLVGDNLGDIRDHYGLNCIELVCPGYAATEEVTDPGQTKSLVKWEAKATGNGGECLVVDCVPPSGLNYSIGKTNVHCHTEDEKGNERNCSFQVSVIDKEEPAFQTCHLDTTIATDPEQPTAMVVWNQPEASDNSGKVTVSCNYNPGTEFSIGEAIVNCIAHDGSGNKKECHFTVSVVDNEKPELESCPSSITQNTDPELPTGVVVWTKPEAHDNSGKVSVSCSYESGANFSIGETEVDCIAVDESGNEIRCSFTVSIGDKEDPKFETCPLDMTYNTDPGQSTAMVVWNQPEASDNSGKVTLSCNYNPVTEFPIGEEEVSCIALDGSGNKKECHFIVSVEDKEDPKFETCPLDMTYNTDPGQSTAMVVWNQPEASDNSGKVTVSCNYNPVTEFPIGEEEVSCIALDGSGNKKECHFIVSVEDKEEPKFETCPLDMAHNTYHGQSTAMVVWHQPEASDNSGKVTVSCNYNPATEFPFGEKVVSCIALDGSGNKKECYFIVSVEDKEEPEFETCPMDMTYNTDPGQSTAMVVWNQPEASDNSGKVTVLCNYKPDTDFPIGHALVNCTALDGSGNTKECYFTVSVMDNEKPELGSCPLNITQNTTNGLPTAVVVWTKPEARDNSGKVSVSCSYESGANVNIGDTVVNCVAVDDSGNEIGCTFTVCVEDNEAPELEICPSVLVEDADPCKSTAVVAWPELHAHDNAGETSITCSYNSGAEFAIGDTMVQCRAIDGSGNEKGCDFIVSVADNCGACWTTFQNHQYFVTCATATFDNAQKACKQMGAELASIHNQTEQDFIGGYTKSDASNEWWGYWIGLVNRGASSDFIWTDGTAADFKNWNTGEPNLESEECGQMVPRIYHKWNDCPCSWELGYVCKKQTKRK